MKSQDISTLTLKLMGLYFIVTSFQFVPYVISLLFNFVNYSLLVNTDVQALCLTVYTFSFYVKKLFRENLCQMSNI